MSTLALVWDLIAIDNASGTFKKVGAEAEAATGVVGKFAATMGAAALGAALAYSVKQASDFQAQMVLIKNLTGAAGQTVQGMTGQLLAMAGQTAQAPEALATSLYHMASIGLQGQQALDAVRVAAEGAAVGHADLEQTTNSLTSTIASGISKNMTYTDTMSKLLAIVGTGDMSLGQLNEALGSGLFQVMSSYNVSLDQVGAALAAFGDGNIRGADAATALRMATQSFFKTAQGGDAILQKYGLSADKLKKDMTQGGLTQALDDLHTHLADAGVKSNQFGDIVTEVFGKKAGVGLAVLLQEFDRYHQKLGEMQSSTNTLGDKFTAVTKTAKFQFRALEDSLQAVSVKVGTALLPALGGAASWLTGTGIPAAERFASKLEAAFHSNVAHSMLAEAKTLFGDLEGTVKRLAAKGDDLWTKLATSSVAKNAQKIIGEFADGLSGVIASIGDWGSLALTAIGGIGSVALPILGGLLAIVGGIAQGFADLPGPIRDVIAALVGLKIFTGTNLLSGLLGSAAVAGTGGRPGTPATGLRGLAAGVVGRGGSAARATGGLVGRMGASYGFAQTVSQQYSQRFGAPGSGLVGGIGSAFRGIASTPAMLSSVGYNASWGIVGGLSTMANGVRTALDTTKSALSAFSTSARSSLSDFGAAVDEKMIGAQHSLSMFTQSTVEGVQNIPARFLQMKTATSDYFDQLHEYATTPSFNSWVPFRTLNAVVGDASTKLHNLATDAFARVTTAISPLDDKIAGLGRSIGTGLQSAASTAVTAIRNLPTTAGSAMTALGGKISSGWETVKSSTANAATLVASHVSGMGAALGTLADAGFGKVLGAGKSLVQFLGGPWGIALIGASTAGAALYNWLSQTSNVIHDTTVKTDDLTTAIENNSGAIDANVRKQAASNLQKAGLFKAAGQWGVSTTDLTSAAMGDPAAIAKVTKAAQGYSKAQLDIANSAAVQADKTGIAGDAYHKAAMQSDEWLQSLLGVKGATAHAIDAAKQLDVATYGNVSSISNLKGVVKQMGLDTAATWNGNTVTLSAASAAQEQTLRNLGMSVTELPDGKGISVSLNDQATPAIDALIKKLQTINTGSYFVNVYETTSGQKTVGKGFNATGNIIRRYATGGLEPNMRAGLAKVVAPNTWRVIGDRVTDDEAYIPINGSQRSRQILGVTAERMGYRLAPMAAGGYLPMRGAAFGSVDGGAVEITGTLEIGGDGLARIVDGRIVSFAKTATNRGRY